MNIYTRLLLLLFSAGSFSAVAQRNEPSTVVVRAVDGVPIAVSLDGRRFSQTGTELYIRNVRPGRKRLVVYRLVPHRYDRGATARVVYEGRFLARPGEATQMDIHTRTGNLTLRSAGEGTGVRPVLPENPSSAARPMAVETPAPTTPMPVAGDLFEPAGIQQAVESKTTDTERLRLMQDAAKGKAITASSLHRMASWLVFEDSRLVLVKALAGQVQDRNNLSSLRSLFRQADSQAAFEALL